ncbi:Uncharacterised protein [Vibrio cholerae]|nr:Uncharacterised protein [Vibrio cholerae]
MLSRIKRPLPISNAVKLLSSSTPMPLPRG